ncbi:MAG: GNAT family N-acetyltransferase [Chloroflexota bacterium]
MNLQISRLEPSQAKAVVNVHNSAFARWSAKLPACYRYQPLQIERAREWLQLPAQTIWVAWHSGTPIGYACCQQRVLPYNDEICLLHFDVTHEDWGQSRIGVVPEFQGQGVATQLLQTIVDDFTMGGGHLVTAYGYNFNPAATRLFTKLGFVNSERFVYIPFSSQKPFTFDSVFAQLDLAKPLPSVPHGEELAIRPLHEGDTHAIRRIFQESSPFAFDGEPSDDALAEWWWDEHADIRLVATIHGEVVGLMECYRDGVIGIPGVLPTYRRRRYGSTLFYHLLASMQQAGYQLAVGDTGVVQKGMIRLYQRFGFDCSPRLLNWIYS